MSSNQIGGLGRSMDRLSFHPRVGQPAWKRLGLSSSIAPVLDLDSASGIPHGDGDTYSPQAGKIAGTARGFGFPIPGPQDPTPESAIGEDYFVTDNEFEDILNDGDYDYIVIGSSFMALAFIEEAWQRNANVRILVLERGAMWLPSHFQNLPLPFRLVLGGRSETFPWTLSEDTYHVDNVPGINMAFLRGSCPFFGGKSTVWSAWCPNPPLDLFREFPKSMVNTMEDPEFWKGANDLLNVKAANQIMNGIFGSLQDNVDKILYNNLADIPSATYSEAAKLAIGPNYSTSAIRFTKYSVPGPMLALVERFRNQITISESENVPKRGSLQIVTNCVVTRLGAMQKDYVRAIETSRGTLSFTSNRTKIILCGGVVPNTTLVLNSFEGLRTVAGKRLTGHFLSHVTARVPKEALKQSGKGLQIGANYLAGAEKNMHNKLQYHIQITAIYCPKPQEQQEDLARECPDFAAAPTFEQLEASTNSVVFVCASLGEIDGHKNYVKFNNKADPTTNVEVHYQFTDDEKALWDTMDEATFQAIKVMSNGCEIEYWHEGQHGKPGFWSIEKPPLEEVRIPGIVHEASTLFMGAKEKGGSVGEDYVVHGTKNVYVTGAAIFPTCGSWNPTLAMCGFSRDLAKKIVPRYGEE